MGEAGFFGSGDPGQDAIEGLPRLVQRGYPGGGGRAKEEVGVSHSQKQEVGRRAAGFLTPEEGSSLAALSSDGLYARSMDVYPPTHPPGKILCPQLARSVSHSDLRLSARPPATSNPSSQQRERTRPFLSSCSSGFKA